MSIPEKTLFVVGDDAQTIYSFRGSKIELILNFEKIFPNSTKIILNKNYRSSQSILNLAEQVISLNPYQFKKQLEANNTENDLVVRHYVAMNEKDEVNYILKQIIQRYGDNKIKQSIEEEEPQNIQPTPTNEVYYQDDKKASTDSISSMFDIYLDEDEAMEINVGQSLWGGVDRQISRVKSFGWHLPVMDWSKINELNDCVILYRTHAQSRSIEEELLKNKIPYKLVSGVRFLERKEIKDVLSILRFIANHLDTLAMNRFMPLVIEGLGPKTLEKVRLFLSDPDYPLSPKIQDAVNNILTNFNSSLNKCDNLIELTKQVLDSCSYYSYLKKEFPSKDEFLTRTENIAELYSLMAPIDEQVEINLKDRLSIFLNQISLMTNAESSDNNEKNQPKISLMTLHQSKGLEFDSVFMVGIEDGLLPHQNSLFEPDGLEEEVRLAYVGITRAKRYLDLISADSRMQFGQVKRNPISRIFRPFLDNYTKRVI
jgi:superfamily I DNA/RNA helicase